MSTGQKPAVPPTEEALVGTFQGGLKDLHATLVSTRNLEINLFWQRANYFLVLNSGLALGVFNLKDQKYFIVFAIVGILAAFLWWRVCLGGKYWQTRWEQRLSDFEKRHLQGLEFFSASRQRVQDDVRAGLAFSGAKGFKKWVFDRMLALRPSVSFCMIVLALCFFWGWIALTVMLLWPVVLQWVRGLNG
jgi:hypothetical protein